MPDKVPDNWIQIITQTVMNEIDKQEQDKKKAEKDFKFRNTELLCKNYRKLSAHCAKLPDQIKIIKSDIDQELFDQPIDLKEVMKSKHKTSMMMQYVDAMTLAYKHLSQHGSDVAIRRFGILYDMYLSPKYTNPGDLFEKYGVERSTFYRDLRKSVEEFSVILFGLDASEFDLAQKWHKSGTNK